MFSVEILKRGTHHRNERLSSTRTKQMVFIKAPGGWVSFYGGTPYSWMVYFVYFMENPKKKSEEKYRKMNDLG